MTLTRCEKCTGLHVPLAAENCPACGTSARRSNVRAAELPEEKAALETRYALAREEATARAAGGAFAAFEGAMARTEAVLAVSWTKIDSEFLTGTKLYSTYYAQVEAEVRVHGEWDARRRSADEKLFPGYKERIRFAALSLDGKGLPNYGDCYFVLKEDLIEERSSVLEEDGLHFAEKHEHPLPPGFRASWQDRAKLATAKLANRLKGDTPETDFPGILLGPGATKSDDRFVEVHIWGPVSIHTFARALVTKQVGHHLFRKELKERFENHGIPATIEP